MAAYKRLDQIDVKDRRVLVRSDLNVPLVDGEVGDDFRLQAALGTIEYLRTAGAVVVVCSHLGRPENREPELSLAPVTKRLSELGGFPLSQLPEVIGASVEEAVGASKAGDVLVLENTRYEKGETKNDPVLSAELARLADLFVQDAFGSVHRAHASTVGVAELLPSVAGPLLTAEVESLSRFLGNPPRPYVVVLGGAKVSDKLGVIKSLLPLTDAMLIGGGMCFTLLKAEGYEVGSSLVEEDMIDEVKKVVAGDGGDRLLLPLDLVAAESFSEEAASRIVDVGHLREDELGLDIGPQTAGRFASIVEQGGSVFWNGPMGVFEWAQFRSGTEAVALALSRCNGFTAVGGGDSVAALRLLGLEAKVDHLSTGGGAGLELLEGKELPGVKVLEKWA